MAQSRDDINIAPFKQGFYTWHSNWEGTNYKASEELKQGRFLDLQLDFHTSL